MAKQSVIEKALIYGYDPSLEPYPYDITHSTEYPYNDFPLGANKRRYMKTRFRNWEPVPQDIIIRHNSKQMIVNFKAIFGDRVKDPAMEIFQLRSRRPDMQNIICEQVSFFCALYDPDNDLITSMFIAKNITDSQKYTINTINELYDELYETLFPPKTIEKIERMVDENDVGDDVKGLFDLSFLRDSFIVTFQMKLLHIYLEHFIMSTGNEPKTMYDKFAMAYTETMKKRNPNMYAVLYDYVYGQVKQFFKSNANMCDMRAIDGVTHTTLTNLILRKDLMCNGLIKLTFASEWDAENKRPTYSCVGLIKSVVNNAASVVRKTQLRYSLVTVDDPSQLLDDSVSSASMTYAVRAFNPGEFMCMTRDLSMILSRIAEKVNLSSLDFYIMNLPMMNDLTSTLINAVLYNKFHTSISTKTISQKERYILLLYVRRVIMELQGVSEEGSVNDPVINILTAKTVTSSNKSLTKKDLDTIHRFASINNLKDYLLTEANVQTFIQSILNCVLSSYTIVNHNDPSMLNKPLVYESTKMTLDILDMICKLFNWINDSL